MNRLGIFGGTFDPVHFGHIKPALHAASAFSFDRLLFVPAANPPHKQGQPRTSFAHRFAMLALATQEHAKVCISDIELSITGPSYTLAMLRLLGDRLAADHYYFLMGSDSFALIETWFCWQELVDRVNLVVLHRPTLSKDELIAATPAMLRSRLVNVVPGAVVDDPAAGSTRIYLLANPGVAVSSTEVRTLLHSGGDVEGLIPSPTRSYIAKHELYH